MFPLIHFDWFGSPQIVPTFHALILLSALTGWMVSIWLVGDKVGPIKISAFIASMTLSGLIGARLLHVLWERPTYYWAHPGEIFTRGDGAVYYGGFLLAALTAMAFMRWIARPSERAPIWDAGAVSTAISVGILRIGCFASGCCWGKMTKLPWAVVFYDDHAATPWLGIPLHPVQLYESFLAFVLAGVLIHLYRNRTETHGKLIHYFGVGYGLIRFFTEFFRGDSHRGVSLLLGLSTSQIISVVVIAFCAQRLGLLARVGDQFRQLGKVGV